MSFKEVYSKANDDLRGNPEVLEKILASAQKKNKIPLFIPVVAVAAMIAMIIAVPYMAGKMVPNPVENVRVVKKEMPKLSENPSSEPDVIQEDVPKNVSQPVADDVPKVAMVEPEDVEAYEPNNIIPEPAVSAIEEPAVAEEPVITTSDTWNVNYTQQLAGADASFVSMSREIKPTKDMTYEEYSEYIGKDITATAVIPEDMTMMSPEIVTAEIDEQTGEIVSEKATYYAHSEDYERFAEINVTRTRSILIPDENMEKSEICGNSVIVLSDNTDFNASFSESGVQFFIRCGGVTETELKNLLISLNGGSTNEQENFGGSDVGSNCGIVSGNDDGIGR